MKLLENDLRHLWCIWKLLLDKKQIPHVFQCYGNLTAAYYNVSVMKCYVETLSNYKESPIKQTVQSHEMTFQSDRSYPGIRAGLENMLNFVNA